VSSISLHGWLTLTRCLQSSAATSAQYEFGTAHTLSIFLFVSVYVLLSGGLVSQAFTTGHRYLLGQGLGGVIFPPYSEAFGRKKLYSTGLYSIFCVFVAVVPSLAGVVIGRFVTGFLSAIPTVVVAGSIEDMFNAKDRIWLIFLWAMVSNIGLITGPIMSTYITAALGW